MRAELEVAGSKARTGAVRVRHEVEPTVLRSLVSGPGAAVIRAAKERFLPAIALAARERGPAPVRYPGDELAAILALHEEPFDDRAPLRQGPVRVKIEGY